MTVKAIGTVQLWLTIAALTLAPLFFGSVDRVWVSVWAVVLSFGTICAAAAAPINAAQRWIVVGICLLAAAYAAVALLQVLPSPLSGDSDSIWLRPKELLGLDVAPRISSRAEIPPIAIGHFLIAVTSLLCGFFAGVSRRNADRLVTAARYSILIYAVYGLTALAVTPDLLLWARKLAYRGSLTSTFVNHNTAATLIGAGMILCASAAFLTLQTLRWSSLRVLLLTPTNERVALELLLRAAAALICFFALLLTGSRGGLICSCLGLLVAFGLMLPDKFRVRSRYMAGLLVAALLVTSLWLSGAGRIGSQGAFDAGRWTVYQMCLDAIRQRPLLGAGIGTFADLFPSLRTESFESWGVWDFAHSTVIEIAFEMGVPLALALVLAASASVVILARAALRSGGWTRGTFAALTGIAVLTYLHAMIDFSLQIPGYAIVFGILLGCGLARATAGDQTKGSTSSSSRRRPRSESQPTPSTFSVAPDVSPDRPVQVPAP
jgi:O-antigen ligase